MKADGHTFPGRMNRALPKPALSESFIHKTHMEEGGGREGGQAGWRCLP